MRCDSVKREVIYFEVYFTSTMSERLKFYLGKKIEGFYF